MIRLGYGSVFSVVRNHYFRWKEVENKGKTSNFFFLMLYLLIFFRDQVAYVSASASEAVDFTLIPSRVKPTTVKLVFTTFLLDAQL